MSIPDHWFRHVSQNVRLDYEPTAVEYLNAWTGETFIHTGGTAYWDPEHHCLDRKAMIASCITHWRLRTSDAL